MTTLSRLSSPPDPNGRFQRRTRSYVELTECAAIDRSALGRKFTLRRSIQHVINEAFQGPTAIRETAVAGTIWAKAVRRATSLGFVD
jgi:hypothetical protein